MKTFINKICTPKKQEASDSDRENYIQTLPKFIIIKLIEKKQITNLSPFIIEKNIINRDSS